MSGTKKGKITQIGILVWDIEKATAAWKKFLGVEPILAETAEYNVTGATYGKNPCYGMIKQAMFNIENTQIELISPSNDEASVWRDCLEKNGEGLHHIAFLTDNSDESVEELEKDGYPVMQFGYWPDEPKNGKYTYVDARDGLKTIVELLEC